MKPSQAICGVAGALIIGSAAQGAAIFTQNFQSSTTVADYVSATPSANQFNSIGTSGAGMTVAIDNGALSYTRTATNSGSFSRTTDFGPVPAGVTYAFTLSVTGTTAATTSAATFQIGSGFTTNNSTDSNASTYARFAISLGATAGSFSIRDITNATNSAAFTGSQQLFWVLNNTGEIFSYIAPDLTTVNLANDLADLWVGNSKVLGGVAVETATQSMSDIKFVYSGGTATIAIDNLVITPIPEPAATLSGGILGGLVCFLRQRRNEG